MHKLCSSQSLLAAATRAGKAIAALNFYNAETLIAHMRAANALMNRSSCKRLKPLSTILGCGMIMGMATAAADQLEQTHGSSFGSWQ